MRATAIRGSLVWTVRSSSVVGGGEVEVVERGPNALTYTACRETKRPTKPSRTGSPKDWNSKPGSNPSP
jgi:hypothetical protein